jgi:outer membrane protein OmpA-like peptidoglycan-associated protein
MSKFLPWIVLLLAALGLFYFVQKGCGISNETTETTPEGETLQTEVKPASEDISTSLGASGSSVTYTLKDGTKMDLERTSFSAWMVDFLKGTAPGSSGYNAATPNCMPFDKVSFDSKTGALTATSEEQLHQLYTIMKAYPDVVISIEGHTDNSGDPDQNKFISEQKAQKIKTWLEGKGIAADRLIASGWGDRNPKASNDTEEGRKTNQRVESCIIKK